MAINQKDIKLLWGRSGNRCAICKKELTQDKNAVTATFTLGEQAHIVAESEDGPRGKATLTLEERNSYHNLILLCPSHHVEIDSNVEDWTTEKIYNQKSQHELWVTETLNQTTDNAKLAQQISFSSMIDSAVTLCELENWQNWTSYALAPEPTWDAERPDNIFKFREKIISMIWTEDCNDLKRASNTFSILLNTAAQTFMENVDRYKDTYYPHKFYKAYGYNENYDVDLKKYQIWIDKCHNLIKESTKAANWFADEVRKSINPMFFIEKGKFLITMGPCADMSYQTKLLEFTDVEKKDYPEKLNDQQFYK
jgi:hypothetical protein